jgi:hypothetical protein
MTAIDPPDTLTFVVPLLIDAVRMDEPALLAPQQAHAVLAEFTRLEGRVRQLELREAARREANNAA